MSSNSDMPLYVISVLLAHCVICVFLQNRWTVNNIVEEVVTEVANLLRGIVGMVVVVVVNMQHVAAAEKDVCPW